MKLKLYILLLLLLPFITYSQDKPKYLDPNLPVNVRVDDLLSKMTLSEKVSQMAHSAPAIDRLGIPKYDWWDECLHGVARNGLATVFPQAIGLAATWDKNLMHSVGNAISDEARAKYNDAIKKGERGIYQGLTFWSPNINIFRDPRWGRGQETYGEDPYLTGQMAVQFIKGLQGNNPKYFKVIATAKHYGIHSGPEPLRHEFDVNVSNYDLYETYLPAFKASVEQGDVQSIMCAYNSFRGHACCSNDPLLDKILRKDWGFSGYVVSDCDAVKDIYTGHKQAQSLSAAAAYAVDAGTDLNCGNTYSHLPDAVKEGLINEASIDTSVKRLFTARFKLGMFDPPSMVPWSNLNLSVVDSKEHRKLAVKVADESIVLLKNENNLLPFKKDIKSIAVIGPNANNEEVLLGNYNGFPSLCETPFEGIKVRAGKNINVIYARGCDLAKGMPSLTIIPSENLYTSEDKKIHGLKGEYFNNFKFEGKPVFERVDPKIDFNWWNGIPRKDFNVNDFCVRWSGYLVPSITGRYVIGGYCFNSVRIYIDDSLRVKFFNAHEPRDAYDTLNLEAGKVYKIKIEYYENTRFGMAHLLWEAPDDQLEEEAVDAVKKADVTVLCMGISPRLEGEEMKVNVKGFKGGDRLTLDLPVEQQEFIKKIVSIGKPVVLVLINGSALSVNWANKNVPAIVESWYGGQAAGTAIANVLFGDYNPGGKLPVTFYKSVDELPPFTDYDMKGRTYRYFEGPVLYPFGYGLSFSTFSFENLRLSKKSIAEDGKSNLLVDVTNTGKSTGDEVVQLYVKGRGLKNDGSIESLKGFDRITLKSGEKKTVTFKITNETLQRYQEGKGFVVDKGVHTLLVGSSSSSKDLKPIDITIK